jgi:hypothetical protein
LNCYHKAIRRRCIIKLLGCIEVPYSSDRVEQIDAVLFGGGKINIAKGVYIEGNMGKIIVIKKA